MHIDSVASVKLHCSQNKYGNPACLVERNSPFVSENSIKIEATDIKKIEINYNEKNNISKLHIVTGEDDIIVDSGAYLPYDEAKSIKNDLNLFLENKKHDIDVSIKNSWNLKTALLALICFVLLFYFIYDTYLNLKPGSKKRSA